MRVKKHIDTQMVLRYYQNIEGDCHMKIYCMIAGGSYGVESGYRYWNFRKDNGQFIDFCQSPSVHNFKQAAKLVHKYYPDAEVIFSGDFAGKPNEYYAWSRSIFGADGSED
jgi:hypothetical protein